MAVCLVREEKLREMEERLERSKELLSQKEKEAQGYAQVLVEHGVVPRLLGLRLRNVTRVWYTERKFPPFLVEVLDKSTDTVYTEANHWNVTLRVRDGKGRPVSDVFTMQEPHQKAKPPRARKDMAKKEAKPAPSRARKRKSCKEDDDEDDDDDEDEEEEEEEAEGSGGKAGKGTAKAKAKAKAARLEKKARGRHSEVHGRIILGTRVFSGLSFDRISSKCSGYFQLEVVVTPPSGCNVSPDRLEAFSHRLQIKSCRLFSQDKKACLLKPNDSVSKLPRINEVHGAELRDMGYASVADLSRLSGHLEKVNKLAEQLRRKGREACELDKADLRQAVTTAALIARNKWSRLQKANLILDNEESLAFDFEHEMEEDSETDEELMQ